MRQVIAVLMVMSTAPLAAESPDRLGAPKPPVARRVPKVDVVHGDRREDDYFWIRDKKDPEVKAYLEAENAYTDAVLAPFEPLRESLYKEMLARIKETDVNVPYRKGGFFYYSRTEQGKQYPIYCRKKGSLEAPEQVTIDLAPQTLSIENGLVRTLGAGGYQILGLGCFAAMAATLWRVAHRRVESK